MTYVDTAYRQSAPIAECTSEAQRDKPQALVVIVEDDYELSDAFRAVCGCLDVAVQRTPSKEDLGVVLHRHHPMAVVAQMDSAGQDGCHVLMTVAGYDRHLPVLLITGDEPEMLGAIDAVAEMWQLSSVVTSPDLPSIGGIVDYLFQAGRKGDCLRLMPV